MVFNAGRFEALSDWFGGPGRLPDSLPAASAVGHDGDDFAVHCLLLSRPGVAVENPRQVPAFRYSARYGPRPPCFARATVVPDPLDGAPRSSPPAPPASWASGASTRATCRRNWPRR